MGVTQLLQNPNPNPNPDPNPNPNPKLNTNPSSNPNPNPNPHPNPNPNPNPKQVTQLLEGPAAAVRELFTAIMVDSRHTDCRLSKEELLLSEDDYLFGV
eukprot:scaffold6003_cov42-Phaeocystis_antarctica.AAC.2